jgi:hypothetical protein
MINSSAIIMIIEYDNKIFETRYFPYFRIKKAKGYQVFGVRFPSGFIDRIIVSDDSDMMETFRVHLEYLVHEYMMEDDEALTPHGKKLKEDVYELFNESR